MFWNEYWEGGIVCYTAIFLSRIQKGKHFILLSILLDTRIEIDIYREGKSQQPDLACINAIQIYDWMIHKSKFWLDEKIRVKPIAVRITKNISLSLKENIDFDVVISISVHFDLI